MSTVTEQSIRTMADVIQRELAPDMIILFGSRATGKASDDSDVDLLIVDAHPYGATRTRRSVLARLRKALNAFLVPMDLLLFTKEEFAYWKDAPNHVASQAISEGIILYDRHQDGPTAVAKSA